MLNKGANMRKPIIAGNWKMFKTRDEALAFIYAVNESLPSIDDVDTVICAPFVVLRCLVKRQGENLRIGAQNMHFEEKGAYTGEVSAAMVASTGAKYVILGHSERRAYYHETPEILKTKVELALANGLTPIFCIGEVLEEREAGKHFEVVDAQIAGSLFDLSAEDFGKIILAYEPVWAIGTGKTASAEQAEEILSLIHI
mgnify:FL=1